MRFDPRMKERSPVMVPLGIVGKLLASRCRRYMGKLVLVLSACALCLENLLARFAKLAHAALFLAAW